MSTVAPRKLEGGWDMCDQPWELKEWYEMYFHRNLDTPAKAMHYFTEWPALDPSSSNFNLRIQSFGEVYNWEETSSRLSKMTGPQYLPVLALSQPNFWIIQKLLRTSPAQSPSEMEVLGVVYLSDGVVFQVPSILDLLGSKVNGASSSLSSTFEKLQSLAPSTSTRSHIPWRSAPIILPPTTGTSRPTSSAGTPVPPTPSTPDQADDALTAGQKAKKRKKAAASTALKYGALDKAFGFSDEFKNRLLQDEAEGGAGTATSDLLSKRMTKEEKEVEELMKSLSGAGRGAVVSGGGPPSLGAGGRVGSYAGRGKGPVPGREVRFS